MQVKNGTLTYIVEIKFTKNLTNKDIKLPRRLIEEAFPLQKVSEDSTHEQKVSRGKPNSLHYWPARRPISACRAVTIATLLPDPAHATDVMKAEYTRLSGSPLPERQRDYLCNDLIASLTCWGDESGQGD